MILSLGISYYSLILLNDIAFLILHFLLKNSFSTNPSAVRNFLISFLRWSHHDPAVSVKLFAKSLREILKDFLYFLLMINYLGSSCQEA